MIKIKYTDEKYMREAKGISSTDHLVTLGGVPVDESGFIIYRVNGQVLRDCSNFITVYKASGDTVTYSDNGMVYVEPEVPDVDEKDFHIDEPTVQTPSLEQRVSDLEDAIIELYENMGE